MPLIYILVMFVAVPGRLWLLCGIFSGDGLGARVYDLGLQVEAQRAGLDSSGTRTETVPPLSGDGGSDDAQMLKTLMAMQMVIVMRLSSSLLLK